MNYEENMYRARPGKAADFRRTAKRALKGFWLMAALVTLLASLVGAAGMGYSGSASVGGSSSVNININGFNNPDSDSIGIIGAGEVGAFSDEEVAAFEQAFADLDFRTMGDIISREYPLLGFILTFFVTIFMITMLVSIAVQLFVTSPVKVGYQKFCLNVLDGKQDGITVGTLIEFFKHGYLKTVGLNIVHSFIMGLTTLPMYVCMIIGGAQFIGSLPMLLSEDPSAAFFSLSIFAVLTLLGAIISICISIPVSYAYSMAHVIMADYPNVGVIEAMRLSRQMMKGNKFRLFCLDFSFIGWELLSLCCTCGIGLYFVTPYQQVARAAFYHEISNRHASSDVEFPSINPADYVIE